MITKLNFTDRTIKSYAIRKFASKKYLLILQVPY